MDEAAGAVVDDDVVGDVIGEENDVAGAVAGEAVAILHGRIGAEDAPAGDDAVAEITLAKHSRSGHRAGAGGQERAGGGGAGGFQKVAAGEHGRGGRRAGQRPCPPSIRRGVFRSGGRGRRSSGSPDLENGRSVFCDRDRGGEG